MTIPYHEELENPNRIIEVKNAQNVARCKVLASYITPTGNLADVFTDHGNSDFKYPMLYGNRFINGGRIVDLIPQDPKIIIKDKRDALFKRLIELKKDNCVNIYDISEYYHIYGFHLPYHDDIVQDEIYSEEIRSELIALISGHIAIMDFFIELSEKVDCPKSKWQAVNHFELRDFNDKLVLCIGFDKIESQLRRTITTAKTNVNETFFNYLIMDWHIYQIDKYVIDEQARDLKKLDTSQFSLVNNSPLERELENEITLIKKLVPYNKRKNYFI